MRYREILSWLAALGILTSLNAQITFENLNGDSYLDVVDESAGNLDLWVDDDVGVISYDFVGRSSFDYRVQETDDGFSWANLSSSLAGSGYITECVFGYEEPYGWRLVEFGQASSLIGSITNVSIFGGAGSEKLQKVTEAIKSITGGVLEIELKLPTNPPVTGGGIGIAWPKGASPTVANVKVLGTKVGGITSGGLLVFNVSSSVLPGVPADYEFGMVLTQNAPAKIEFLDASDTVTSELAVAKWVNSFTSSSSSTLKTDFVDINADRFKIRVTDVSKKGDERLHVSLSTINGGTSYNDNADKIQLTETPADSGVFLSQAMMLMSDSADDSNNGARSVSTWVDDNGVLQSNKKRNDNADHDRTHKTKLGGSVHIRYPDTGDMIAEGTANVPPIKKVVVKIVRFNGVSPSTSTISNRWALVEERFAQVGVEVEWSILSAVNPGSGIDFDNNIASLVDASIVAQGGAEMSPEAKLVVDHHRPNKNSAEVYVYYVKNLKVDGDTGADSAKGFAATRWHLKSADDLYGNNIFIDTTHTHYVAAHELGHLLRDSIAHFTSNHSLMRAQPSTSSNYVGSKRLGTDSHSAIHANSTGVLVNP